MPLPGALATRQSSDGSCKPVEVEGFGTKKTATRVVLQCNESIESVEQTENVRWPSELV